MVKNIDIALLLLFIMVLLFINKTYPQPNKKKDRSYIRPSYNDEFYNYNSVKTKENDEYIIKDKYNQLYENFTEFDENLKNEHRMCPVMEGNQTKITSCIHFPNRIPDGSTESISSGFLVSTCCEKCIGSIQLSLNRNDKEYDIIYSNENYILTKQGVKKQTLLECNQNNLQKIISLAGTVSL
tara:strand:+ start:863 stop:1411 length:549 start_codon:yes stop_codon:yes gene_type:complete